MFSSKTSALQLLAQNPPKDKVFDLEAETEKASTSLRAKIAEKRRLLAAAE